VPQSKAGTSCPQWADSRSYLAGLPDSERLAKEPLSRGESHFGELGDGGRFPLGAVHLLEPVEIAALFDFGLTPRHLKNSAEVNGKLRHQGSTSGISHKAEDVFAWLRFIAPLKPGSVMGLGTIPDCTGLVTTTASLTLAPRSKSLLSGSARSGVVLPNRRADCCRAAGLCARRCGSTKGSPPPRRAEHAKDAI
jgi:hypothetical protein